jgi:hypothetical protein
MPAVQRTLTAPAGAAIAAVLVASPAAAAQSTPLRAPGAGGPLGNERLSDERTVTRFGQPARRYTLRAAPDPGARAVGKLHFWTEDGVPETYLVLRSQLDAAGRAWLQVRLPQRPNGGTAWVPDYAFKTLKVSRDWLEVDKRRLRARFYRAGELRWSARVGIGAPGTPTPSGRFWIRERLSNAGGNPAYGPFAFGTSAYSRLSDWPGGGVVGIHGTSQPGLIPGRPSHGCVRLRNAKVLELKRLLRVGTPVHIH